MRRLISTFSVIVAGTGSLGGCGLSPSVEDRAADDAREKARRVGNVLYSVSGWKAQDIGHRAADLRDVEVMRVTERRPGVRLVVRVPGTASAGWMSDQSITVRRCFELRISSDTSWDATPDEVRCPDGPPLVYGPWPKAPEIPIRRLEKALPRVPRSGTVDEAKVRAAIASLRLDPAIRTEVKTEGGVVGALLFAKSPGPGHGPSDCVLARIAPGRTNVWIPPRMQRMPGEGGCGVGNAISPMPPPH